MLISQQLTELYL